MNEQVKACFLHELRLLQKLQHRNVVELLGFCFEYSENLVVEDDDVEVVSIGVLGFISRYTSKKSMLETIIKGTVSLKTSLITILFCPPNFSYPPSKQSCFHTMISIVQGTNMLFGPLFSVQFKE